eukprot:3558528-Amphidinium_carterae.1
MAYKDGVESLCLGQLDLRYLTQERLGNNLAQGTLPAMIQKNCCACHDADKHHTLPQETHYCTHLLAPMVRGTTVFFCLRGKRITVMIAKQGCNNTKPVAWLWPSVFCNPLHAAL